MDEDENKSLQYILENYIDVGQTACYFIKCTGFENIYYGQLNVEQGTAEELDDHCEECFNEPVIFLRFAGDKKLCNVIGVGLVGLKKFNYFKDKNELNKILGPCIEIINVIE